MNTNENQGEIDIVVLFNKIQSTFIELIVFFFKWVKHLTKQWKAFLFLYILNKYSIIIVDSFILYLMSFNFKFFKIISLYKLSFII